MVPPFFNPPEPEGNFIAEIESVWFWFSQDQYGGELELDLGHSRWQGLGLLMIGQKKS